MSDVLQLSLTEVSEAGSNLASDMIVGRRGNANAAGLGDAFEPRRNVDAISKNVIGFYDDITDVNSHTKGDASVFRVTGCELLHAGLELHCRSYRFDCARKFREEPVAGVLHDPATVFGDRRLDAIREKLG
jgi:hypothetical protein